MARTNDCSTFRLNEFLVFLTDVQRISWSSTINLLKTLSDTRHDAINEIFGAGTSEAIQPTLQGIFDKSIKTYFFQHNNDGKVISHDISTLDASSENTFISEWGGLSEFSARVSDVVAKSSNPFIWIFAKNNRILPNSPQARKLAQKGLKPIAVWKP